MEGLGGWAASRDVESGRGWRDKCRLLVEWEDWGGEEKGWIRDEVESETEVALTWK